MGAINLKHTTAGADIVLSSDGTDLLLDGTPIGGGGSSTLVIDNKTAAYTVVAGDLGKIINCTSGTFTISLTSAATLGSGFNVTIWNTSTTSTDAITIDPDGTETLDGRTTIQIYPGNFVELVCTGSAWQTNVKLVTKAIAANTATSTTPPLASGSLSIAIGQLSTASGTRSLAIGYGTVASSIGSTAIGYNSNQQGAQAVTGAGAMALGGSRASGVDSFAAAIADNTASYGATGANSISIGRLAKASGSGSLAIGKGANATNTGAVAISSASGDLITASGVRAIAIGPAFALASGTDSIALGHGRALLAGKLAFGSGYFSNANALEAQTGTMVLLRLSTDATPVALISNNSTPNTTNQIIVPDNGAYSFSGTIIARQKASDGSDFAAWEIKGAILRGANAASTTLGSFNINTLSKTAGATAWTIALTADTTNGGLAITVTGAAATNIRWVATVQTTEVTYA